MLLQLAELWPNRLMDNHGIKRAICRAKERRKALNGNLAKEMVLIRIFSALYLIALTFSQFALLDYILLC